MEEDESDRKRSGTTYSREKLGVANRWSKALPVGDWFKKLARFGENGESNEEPPPGGEDAVGGAVAAEGEPGRSIEGIFASSSFVKYID